MDKHQEGYLPDNSNDSKELPSASQSSVSTSEQFLVNLQKSVEYSKAFNEKSKEYLESLKRNS